MFLKDKAIKTHIECSLCGSSDAATLYLCSRTQKEYKYCYSCNQKDRMVTQTESNNETIYPIVGVSINAIPERDITKDTCSFFSVCTGTDSFVFPYGKTANKIRSKDKKFKWVGKDPIALFGMDRFPSGGKYVTITEGEFDALAAFQMMGSKYPTLSIKNGATGAVKDCQSAFEYLDSFENIVICFDADEPGQKAAKQVAELFGYKAKVVKLSKYKDANEYLMQQASKDFVDAWWRAECFVPDGIVSGASMLDRLKKQKKITAEVMYPFEGVNKLTYGIRKGELVTITAGSGLGKSSFVKEIMYQVHHLTGDNIGAMMLEESAEKTAESMMSIHINKPLHLPDAEYTEDEYNNAFNATMGTGRFYLFDHFGSTSVDNIVARVRYMAKALNCGYIFLDHVSIIVSSQESGDERKAIDEVMTKLRMLVQETGISLILVSHLKRPDGKGHEEGAVTSLNQLRGSGSIAQLSDVVIGLERNGQASDKEERNTTYIRVLKNRFSGLTGPAGSAKYSIETGRMFDVEEEAI